MLQKFLNFVKYNNAFTIIFVVCLLSFGVSFAASPAVRDDIYSSEETVVSVDNSNIVSTNLDNFDFNLKISSVTEDEKNYYAVYTYRTLAIEAGVWQDKQVEKTLTVNKEALGNKDLGLYIAKELGENINYELSYLKKVQEKEKERGESQKVVTVEYSGLIGKFLDPKELVIEGYDPVVPEVATEEPKDEVVLNEEKIKEKDDAEQDSEPEDPEDVVVSTVRETKISDNSSTTTETTGSESNSTSTTETPSSPTPETPTPNPTPEEMVDEKLVKEVVDELLQDQTTPPTPESTEDKTEEPATTEPSTPAPENNSESSVPDPTSAGQ